MRLRFDRLVPARSLAFLSLATAFAPAALATGKIVVANRASGSISVISTDTDQVIATLTPPASETWEPMYVASSPGGIFVGDRANDRVLVIDGDTLTVTGSVPAGAGVFHMWADRAERQLWVVNDIDRTFTVISTITLDVITCVPVPADLVADGGIPHDVVLDPNDTSAFATIVGLSGEDKVLKFSTVTFDEQARADAGQDPHVSLSREDELLFVPAQNTSSLFIFDRNTLTEAMPTLGITGAHGAGMPLDGRYFYTTNLPGAGVRGLITIDTQSGEPVGATDTPYAVPHNIALTPDGHKLYVTHSGMNDKVTIYETTNQSPVPMLVGEVTVGSNPFGLAYAP